MKYEKYKGVNIIPDDWKDNPENVTQDMIEKLLREADEIDAHNKRVYEARKDAYSKLNNLASVVWGESGLKNTESGTIKRYLSKKKVPRVSGTARWVVQHFSDLQSHYISEKEKKERQEKFKRERAEQQKEDQYTINVMAHKYKMDDPAHVTAWCILDMLCEKSKYLNLATAMEKVRYNWQDGYRPVRYALREFEIETDQDQEIYDDVSACFEAFDDGRIFRDTEWNYSRLYELVDSELVQDAKTLMALDGDA